MTFIREKAKLGDNLFTNSRIYVILLRFSLVAAEGEIAWLRTRRPARRRRLGAHGMMFRRRRIFASLREGFTYDEIAANEGVSPHASARSSRGSCSNAGSTAEPNMRSCNWTVSLQRFNRGRGHGRRRHFRDHALSQGAGPARSLSDGRHRQPGL